MSHPRVMLVDDHLLVAEALKSLLAEEFDLVGVAQDGLEMVKAAETLRPDVIVADITMPHLNGIDALPQLRKVAPGTRVVFLTMHSDVAYARRALEAALAGRTFITPTLAGDVFESMRRGPARAPDPVAGLTPRQREILQLFAEGCSAKQIAGKLDISHRTVEFHKYQMMESLHIRTNAELVHFAVKHGIVS
jgi:DNA-binding NarL/FixJ family response regulator